MKILITGNMGYVGPVVVGHLRKRFPSAMLVGLDQGWFSHCLTTDEIVPEADLDEQRFGDVRDVAVEDLEGFDAVVHLAAVSNDPMGKRFEEVTDAINHRSTVSLAQTAAAAGVASFVFASSCSVYGAAEDGRARTEADPVAPITAYARSKIAAEQSLAQLEADMQVTCLRFATACGMSPRLRLDLVLNDFVSAALSSGTIAVLSDGTPWRPLIHVRDMARAIEWALTRGTTVPDRFVRINVGAETWNYQVRELAQAVSRAVDGVGISINADAPPDKRSYRVDFSQYERLAPDHQPRETLDGTIRELADCLTRLGFTSGRYQIDSLIRLRVLEGLLGAGAMGEDLKLARFRQAAAS